MQVIPVIALAVLLGLMTLSGFQLVPQSALGTPASAQQSGDIEPVSVTPVAGSGLSATRAVDSDPVITAVTIKSVQDIERSTATLRGRVVVGPEELGAVFFIYSYDDVALGRSIARADSYTELVAEAPATVKVKRINSALRKTADISTRVGSLAVDQRYYVRACVEVEALLRCSDRTNFSTTVGATKPGDVRLPSVRVSDERIVSAEQMELELGVHMRDTKDGVVYVVYGESKDQVTEAMSEEYRDIDEDGDDIQKERVETGVIGSLTLTETLDDLDDDTTYYHVACVEYDGLRDGVVCTRLQSFATPDDDYGETPSVTTGAVTTGWASATLAGTADMRPLRNGQVFFVYGTDVRRIERIGGEMSMSSIGQSGDRLQRVLLDSDLDRSDSYRYTATDLRFGTVYAARLCVQYTNQNERYRDVLLVECGEVRSFATS